MLNLYFTGGVAFKAGVISPVLQHDVWFHLKMTVKVKSYITISCLDINVFLTQA